MQKIDKKILIMLAVILIAVLSSGFFVFKYLKEIRIILEDSPGEASEEKEELADEDFELLLDEEEQLKEKQLQIDAELPEIETGQTPGLFICRDKCGDAICQISDLECQDNINCACPETKEECPQDCK